MLDIWALCCTSPPKRVVLTSPPTIRDIEFDLEEDRERCLHGLATPSEERSSPSDVRIPAFLYESFDVVCADWSEYNHRSDASPTPSRTLNSSLMVRTRATWCRVTLETVGFSLASPLWLPCQSWSKRFAWRATRKSACMDSYFNTMAYGEGSL